MDDWPSQYPWEIGFGFYFVSENAGGRSRPLNRRLVADFGYRILSHLDVIADFTFPTFPLKTDTSVLYDLREEPEKTQRLSLRAGKFMGPNLEGLAKVYHRSGWRMGDHYGYDSTCTASDRACDGLIRDNKISWHFLTGTGMEFSLRLWLWNRISVECGWGFEYNWMQKNVNGIPFRLLPTFHF